MKARSGSALVLVMCVVGALSILMLRVYWRASLLLQTVVEREQDIKMRCAAEALMLYAARMAKHNWAYLIKHAAQGKVSEHHLIWEIDGAKKVPATCVFKSLSKDLLGVEVFLESGERTIKLSCELRMGKADAHEGNKVVISAWKQE